MTENSSQIEVTVEVLVIGGGIQGVVALAELHKQNFKTLLVTESDIGAGQTLSSQAYLHSGYPWAQHEEVVADIKKAANFWLKWMKDNNIPYNSSQKYFAGPKPFVDTLKTFWHKSELSFQVLQKKTTLPDIFKEGKLFASGTSVVRIQDFTFNIEKLLRVLCTPLNAFMIKGKVTSLHLNEQNNEISFATISLPNNTILIVRAKYFVCAVGVSTSNLLESIHCSDSLKRKNHLEAEKIQRHYASHIICLRGKSELFPPISGFFQAFGLFIVGHEETTEQGQKLTYWLVNPVSLKSMQCGFGSGCVENPHSASLSKEVIGEGLGFLFDCCPRLKELAPQLDWSVYCCYRQDYPEKDYFSMIHVEEFHSISNLCVCLPSLFSLSYVVAEKLIQKVSSKLRPSTTTTTTTLLNATKYDTCNNINTDHRSPSSASISSSSPTSISSSVSTSSSVSGGSHSLHSSSRSNLKSSIHSPPHPLPPRGASDCCLSPPTGLLRNPPATNTSKTPAPGNVRRLSATFEALRRINSGGASTPKGNSLPNHLQSSVNSIRNKLNASVPPLPLNTINTHSSETTTKSTTPTTTTTVTTPPTTSLLSSTPFPTNPSSTSLTASNSNTPPVGSSGTRRPSTPRSKSNISSLLNHSPNSNPKLNLHPLASPRKQTTASNSSNSSSSGSGSKFSEQSPRLHQNFTSTTTPSQNVTNMNSMRSSISRSQVSKVLTFQEETVQLYLQFNDNNLIANLQQNGAKVGIAQQHFHRPNFKWMKWQEFSELYPTKTHKTPRPTTNTKK